MQENLSEVGAILIRVYCSLKTTQKKFKENLNKGRHESVFLTEVIYLGNEIERNRIDFPKQIRIKRKYLLVVRQVPIQCRIGAGGVVSCKADEET